MTELAQWADSVKINSGKKTLGMPPYPTSNIYHITIVISFIQLFAKNNSEDKNVVFLILFM